MRRPGVVQWLTIAAMVTASLAIAQKSTSARSKQAASRHAAATLVVSCDVACGWRLDGEDKNPIAAGASARVSVEPGEHIVAATTDDGKDQIKKEIDVETGGSIPVELKLRPVRIARLKQELADQEASIEKFKAETDPKPTPSPEPAPAPDSSPAGPGESVRPHDGNQDHQGDATPANQLEVSSAVTNGMLIENPAPVYPAVAQAAGISGTVVLRGTIAKDGSVKDLSVVSGPEPLQQSAMDAVSRWKYMPYRVNGQAVEVTTKFTIVFSLRPKPPEPAPAPRN